MADEVQQGNKPADYKGDYDENKSREARQVRMWRDMIQRASGDGEEFRRLVMASLPASPVTKALLEEGQPKR